MIEYVQGDILDAQTEAIVNPVNCVGVSGAGLALQFRDRFPTAQRLYREACEKGVMELGRMFVVETNGQFPYVIYFPTKKHWKDKSKLDDIIAGLEDLARVIEAYNVRSISLPALGCGLGGLLWEDVKVEIENVLGGLITDIKVYEPQ